MHDIVVEMTAAEVDSAPYSRISHRVDWPHMWTPGDHVAVETTDGRHYDGTVIDVSRLTRAVLIYVKTSPEA